MMKTIQVGDLSMAVEDRGEGPVVLLVHGFPLDHTMWRFQVEGLSDAYRLIAPDLRGFGKSGVTPGKVSMEQLADDLAGLLDALQIAGPVVFCGLSMGGYVGWQFWRKHRDRLAAMILCDTRAVADTPEAAAMRRQMADDVLARGSVVAAEAMRPKLFGESTRREQPEVVEQLGRVMESTNPVGVAAAQRGIAERIDASGLLGEIASPVLVIVGEHDAISTAAEMRQIAKAIPGAEYCEIPDAGHMAPLEKPDVVNARIRAFLQQHLAAGGA
jgi:pimeloyl-ACP methyl ester carboxylesterase